MLLTQTETRTTRTPAFWGYPLPPHDHQYHGVILDPKSKEDKVKVTNLKNSAKFQWILTQTLHTTHLLKLLDKMCKYKTDPMSIVEDTERTRFCPQTDKVKPIYPPFNFVEVGGIIMRKRDVKEQQYFGSHLHLRMTEVPVLLNTVIQLLLVSYEKTQFF